MLSSGRKLEEAPKLKASRVQLPSGDDPYASLAAAQKEEEALKKRLAEIERHKARELAAQKREFEAKAEAEWEKAQAVARGGGIHGKKALQLFLSRWSGKSFPNPHQKEAKALLVQLEEEERIGKAGIKWVRIEGGSFRMGSNNGSSDEKPVHRVRVPTFWISKTEVTVGQYRSCVQAGACSAPDECHWGSPNWGKSGIDDHPVNCVSWEEARSFAKWAGGRLPSESEWEFAARNRGENVKYPWGNVQASCRYAVMDDGGNGCGTGGTLPVCSKTRGETKQGLCDMSGNVWEWVEDVWVDNYRETPRNGAPNRRSGSARVNRGGSWNRSASHLRAAYRDRGYPGRRNSALGFRLAR